MGREIVLTLRNDLGELSRLAEAVDSFGTELGVPAQVLYHFNLAFDEFITNTVSYGYMEAGEHAIEVRVGCDGERFWAEMSDDGRPFDPFSEAPEPDLDSSVDERRIGGLGVYLVKTLMDEVSYRREGDYNRIYFAKRLAANSAGDHQSQRAT